MLFSEFKLFINELYKYLKNNILSTIFLSLFIFSAIWLGNVISVITSRQILDTLSIKVEGVSPNNLSSIRVLATLSRAGNTMNLTRILEGDKNQWNNPSQTFVKKILIGLNSEDLKQLSKISIKLGNKDFVYTNKQFVNNWKEIDTKEGAWYMSDINNRPGYVVYEAPTEVKVKPWNADIPLVSGLLSSINFRGSEFLILKPIISSFKLFVLILFVLVIVLYLLSLFTSRNLIVQNTDEDFQKKQFITFSLVIISTTVIIFLFCIIIRYLYRPDTSNILLEASKMYISKFLPSFMPKPVERMQFTLSVLLSPFVLLFLYKLFSKKINRLTKEMTSRFYIILSMVIPSLLFSITYIGLAVSNFMYVEKTFFFSGVGTYLYSLILFPIGLCYIFVYKKGRYDKLADIIFYIFSGVLLFSMFFISIIGVSKPNMDMLNIVGHANPIFFPISQVMAGKTLLVNLTSQYGLYPVFLEPIFKLIGLNMLSLTSLMGVLLSLSFLFIFLFLHRVIKNKIILFLGFCTIMFYFLDGSASPYPYFQYWPIRTLFPAILLYLSTFYFNNKNKFLYYLLFFISAVAVLWNFDSGIIVFLSWMAVLIYMEIFGDNKKAIIKNIILHILWGLIALCLVISGYTLYSFLRAGQLPNISLFFAYQKLFYDGFMMIAMPFPHTWVLIMLIFLSGLLWSVKSWVIRDNNYRNFSIFLLSILGVGLFSYYEGRSHDATLYTPIYLPLMLLPIILDSIYNIVIKNSKLYGHIILFAFVFFFLLVSPFSLINNSHRYYNSVKAGFDSFFTESQTTLSNNIDFIKSNTDEGESVVMLTGPFDGAYFGETHTRSALDIPSFTEVFFKREADYIINFLKCNRSVKVFVYPFSKFYDQFGNDLVDARINALIKSDYSVVGESSDDMVIMMNNLSNFGSCINATVNK